MRRAGRFCANDPEPFDNCGARDRYRKSRAAAASPDIPAAYPQKRRSEHSTNLRMSEGLQLKSRDFLSTTGRQGRDPGFPGPPAWTGGKSVKIHGTPDPSGLWIARYSDKFTKRKGPCMRLVLERGVPQEERDKVA